MDETEEGEGLKRYREARANEMFPDEVDTPLDVAAKTRYGPSIASALYKPFA